MRESLGIGLAAEQLIGARKRRRHRREQRAQIVGLRYARAVLRARSAIAIELAAGALGAALRSRRGVRQLATVAFDEIDDAADELEPGHRARVERKRAIEIVLGEPRRDRARFTEPSGIDERI